MKVLQLTQICQSFCQTFQQCRCREQSLFALSETGKTTHWVKMVFEWRDMEILFFQWLPHVILYDPPFGVRAVDHGVLLVCLKRQVTVSLGGVVLQRHDEPLSFVVRRPLQGRDGNRKRGREEGRKRKERKERKCILSTFVKKGKVHFRWKLVQKYCAYQTICIFGFRYLRKNLCTCRVTWDRIRLCWLNILVILTTRV